MAFFEPDFMREQHLDRPSEHRPREWRITREGFAEGLARLSVLGWNGRVRVSRKGRRSCSYLGGMWSREG